MNKKILRCKKCGSLLLPLTCKCEKEMCKDEDKPMEEIVPNTVDAAKEKHIPVYTLLGNHVHVEVGSTLHPMSEEHFIEWIMLETSNGVQIHFLKPGDEPTADFYLAPGTGLVRLLAYCNLHGLWSKDI